MQMQDEGNKNNIHNTEIVEKTQKGSLKEKDLLQNLEAILNASPEVLLSVLKQVKEHFGLSDKDIVAITGQQQTSEESEKKYSIKIKQKTKETMPDRVKTLKMLQNIVNIATKELKQHLGELRERLGVYNSIETKDLVLVENLSKEDAEKHKKEIVDQYNIDLVIE